MTELSIILVSWNTRDLLLDCIESIYAHTTRPFEILVVDNCSADDTAAALAARFPDVRLIANPINVGFGRANNQAAAAAAGRYLVLLNPDTKLLNDALDRLADYLDQHPDVGAVGPRLVRADGSIQYTCARRLPSLLSRIIYVTPLVRWLRSAFDWENLGGWDHQDSRPVAALSGACMVVRRETRVPHIFDEQFFMYGEDIELCWYIGQQAQRGIYYLADAHVLHLGGQSAKQAPRLGLENVYSSYLLLRRIKGRAAAWVFRVVTTVFTSLRVLLLGLRLLIRRDGRTRSYLDDQVAILRWLLVGGMSAGANR